MAGTSVKMERIVDGETRTANIHPDNVEACLKDGWVKAGKQEKKEKPKEDSPAPAKKKAAKKKADK